MAMRWSVVLWVGSVTWMALTEWLSTCFIVATQIAHSLQQDEEEEYEEDDHFN